MWLNDDHALARREPTNASKTLTTRMRCFRPIFFYAGKHIQAWFARIPQSLIRSTDHLRSKLNCSFPVKSENHSPSCSVLPKRYARGQFHLRKQRCCGTPLARVCPSKRNRTDAPCRIAKVRIILRSAGESVCPNHVRERGRAWSSPTHPRPAAIPNY